jgi:hypothetical protein
VEANHRSQGTGLFSFNCPRSIYYLCCYCISGRNNPPHKHTFCPERPRGIRGPLFLFLFLFRGCLLLPIACCYCVLFWRFSVRGVKKRHKPQREAQRSHERTHLGAQSACSTADRAAYYLPNAIAVAFIFFLPPPMTPTRLTQGGNAQCVMRNALHRQLPMGPLDAAPTLRDGPHSICPTASLRASRTHTHSTACPTAAMADDGRRWQLYQLSLYSLLATPPPPHHNAHQDQALWLLGLFRLSPIVPCGG